MRDMFVTIKKGDITKPIFREDYDSYDEFVEAVNNYLEENRPPKFERGDVVVDDYDNKFAVLYYTPRFFKGFSFYSEEVWNELDPNKYEKVGHIDI